MKFTAVILGIILALTFGSVACAQWVCEGGVCYQAGGGYAASYASPVYYDYGYSQPVGISQGVVYGSGYGSAGGFGSSVQAYGSTGGYATSYGSQGGYSVPQSFGTTTIVRQRVVTQTYGSTGSYAVPRRIRR